MITPDIEALLKKVDIKTSYVKLSLHEHKLMREMRNTICTQQQLIEKREKLVYSISHNVQYLAKLHKTNKEEQEITKAVNKGLREQNAILKKENDQLKAAEERRVKQKQELDHAMSKLNRMMNDHDLLQDTIQDQYDTMEANKDEMEKIRLEVTVISAEKTMQKKELNRVNTLYTKLQRDNKENREAYNVMVDEVSKINITNSGYRALIVESDGKMAAFQKDVRSLQQTLETQKKLCSKYQEEKETIQKQMNKLLAEMKQGSDSESAEYIDQRVDIVELKQKNKILTDRVKTIAMDLESQLRQEVGNVDSLQKQYDYSCKANASLREDYDLLSTKLDKMMKTSNNQIQDRNEQID